MRAQAVPLASYRRQVALAQMRRQLVLVLAVGVCVCAVSPSWLYGPAGSRPQRSVWIGSSLGVPSRDTEAAPTAISVQSPAIIHALDVPEANVDDDESADVVPSIRIADTSASTSHLDEPGIFNALIAISFLDGVVIPAGARLSFDDVARTWDYREDPSYVPGKATSIRGLIDMRGGGVCTVSTALWRAALAAGLRTDRRQSHYGLMEPGDPGLDATNTLIIANDSDEAVTIHAWLDEDSVRVRLLADGDLGRTATVSEPQRIGNGRWLLEQEVTWADGRQTTSRFISQYYW